MVPCYQSVAFRTDRRWEHLLTSRVFHGAFPYILFSQKIHFSQFTEYVTLVLPFNILFEHQYAVGLMTTWRSGWMMVSTESSLSAASSPSLTYSAYSITITCLLWINLSKPNRSIQDTEIFRLKKRYSYFILALKSSYSPPTNSNCGVCRGTQSPFL